MAIFPVMSNNFYRSARPKASPSRGGGLGEAETERSSRICDNLSVRLADSSLPLCPFGTFPPDRGNRPLQGEPLGCSSVGAGLCSAPCFRQNQHPRAGQSPAPTECRANKDNLPQKVQTSKSGLHLLLTANIQRQLLTNLVPAYQAARSRTP